MFMILVYKKNSKGNNSVLFVVVCGIYRAICFKTGLYNDSFSQHLAPSLQYEYKWSIQIIIIFVLWCITKEWIDRTALKNLQKKTMLQYNQTGTCSWQPIHLNKCFVELLNSPFKMIHKISYDTIVIYMELLIDFTELVLHYNTHFILILLWSLSISLFVHSSRTCEFQGLNFV